MAKQLRLSVWETLGESAREVISLLLALLLLIPAAVIRVIDRLVMMRIRRRGGLD
jgi:hypothetical protein